MNLSQRFIALLFFILISYNAYSVNDSTRVLFIGNSITYFNNMPDMFRNLANNKGHKISIGTHTPGGSGIVDHYVNNQLYQLIKSKPWDIVILQPGSAESGGVSYPVDVTVQRAHILLDSIYKNNPCTKVFLYQIPYGIPSAGGYPKYFQVQTMIRDSVTKMADSLHLQMLPAGESFRAYYSTAQNLYLHGSINDIHPNANGSFLVASTFYTGIFQDSINGAKYFSSVPKDSAYKFFNIVDSVVLSHKSDWRINTYNLHAEFGFNQNANTFKFLNKSTNFTISEWDFGDGNTSTNNAPLYTYNTNGIYNVWLKVKDQQCYDSTSAEVSINSIGLLLSSKNKSFKCYPNPMKDVLNIEIKSDAKFMNIYDVNGRRIWHKENVLQTSLQVNTSTFPSGTYFIEVTYSNTYTVQKLVKI